MAFQTSIKFQPAPAFEGDFASANQRDSMLAGPGELVAGPNGVTVGRFAWANPEGVVNNSGGVGRLGFVARHGQIVVNPTLLQRFGNLIPAGVDMTMHTSGDFWVKFAGGATAGQKVFANYADGTAVAGTAGTPPAAASATGSIAAGSASFTGSIAPNYNFNGDEDGALMTVTGSVTGTIQPGGTISGTNVITGTTILSQVSGTTGGDGVYQVSISQTVAATTITEAYGTFTAASALTGTFGVGDVISGSSVVAGTQIVGLGTGTGGLGTYIVNNNTVVSSTTISAAGALETRWSVARTVNSGELAPITVHP